MQIIKKNSLLHLIVFIILLKSSYQVNFSHYTKCEADILIGGIFPTRIKHGHHDHLNTSMTGGCDGVLSPTGLQEALAFIYAIHTINENKSLLPNCTLGVELTNSCDSNEIAIRNVLQFDFIREKLSEKIFKDEPAMMSVFSSNALSIRLPIKTVAVVGLRKSSISRSVATMTNLFSVPTISYGSTDPGLTNRKRFRTFARTIPDDELMVKAVISLIEKLEWNIVFTISDSTDYALSSFSLFQKHIETGNTSRKICIAEQFEYSSTFDWQHLNEATQKYPRIRAFILFVHKEVATEFLMKASERDMKNYVWIFSEGLQLTETVKKMTETSLRENTMISLQPRSFQFDKTNQIYQDFVEFTEAHFFEPSLTKIIPDVDECKQKKCLRGAKYLSYFVPYVIDAVYAIAHALSKSNIKCDKTNRTDLRLQMDSLMDVKFKSVLGYDFKFTKGGNVKGEYDILLLKEPSTTFKRIAVWKENEIMNSTEALKVFVPQSTCAETCSIGQGLTIPQDHPECCTSCVQCNKNEYTDRKTKKCRPCPLFYRPTTNQTQCEALPEDYIEYNSTAGLVLTTCAILGQITAVFVIFVFLQYRQTHVIRASSWEISVTMLAGALLCFASPYTIMGHMTNLKCQLHMIGSGLSLSLMIGALFVKTNRIYRIFSKNVLRKGLPKYLSRGWQFAMLSIIVICDLIITVIVTFYPSDPVRHEQILTGGGNQPQKMTSMCRYSKGAVFGWWVFHCSLVFICTYQAVVSRHIPGNYKEARNIMLAMLAITLEMLVILPGFYYSSQTGFYHQIILALVNIVSAYSTVICLFLPKLYIIFWRPAENKETLPHGTLGTFLKIDSAQQRETPVVNTDVKGHDDITEHQSNQSIQNLTKEQIQSQDIEISKKVLQNSNERQNSKLDLYNTNVGNNPENNPYSTKNNEPFPSNSTERNENGEINTKRRKILVKTLTTSIRRRTLRRDKENLFKKSASFPNLKGVAVISKSFKNIQESTEL